jgi:hypothetical protein
MTPPAREKVAEHKSACSGATISKRVENMIIFELDLESWPWPRTILDRQSAFYLEVFSTD